jgi:hypothetical protein
VDEDSKEEEGTDETKQEREEERWVTKYIVFREGRIRE